MTTRNNDVTESDVTRLYEKLEKEAEASSYHLNPDEGFTRDLVHGLCVNEKRYGYPACPCRLASGDKNEDLDIICPCDYRDIDLGEYGSCFCGLYVSEDVVKGEKQITSIPERRPKDHERRSNLKQRQHHTLLQEPLKQGFVIWRCPVCGYLCARDDPPERCPICKASKDRFERFN